MLNSKNKKEINETPNQTEEIQQILDLEESEDSAPRRQEVPFNRFAAMEAPPKKPMGRAKGLCMGLLFFLLTGFFLMTALDNIYGWIGTLVYGISTVACAVAAVHFILRGFKRQKPKPAYAWRP